MSLNYNSSSDHYKQLLTKFIDHYQKEMEIIQDDKLLDELKLLQALVSTNDSSSLPTYNSPYEAKTKSEKSSHDLSDPRHTDEYLHKIKQKIEKLQIPDPKSLPESSNIVELCFLMDCTGSMSSFISMCRRKMNEIVDIITRDNPSTVIRIAFVGYRDHRDAPVKTLHFCTDVNKIKSHIGTINAEGGNDIPEDICGGLLNAINLEWKSRKRLVILIADAPCHGKMYHNVQSDDYEAGDPNGLIPEVLLSQLAYINIPFFFAKISETTDKMTALWKNHLRDTNPDFPLTIFSIQSDDDFVANITDAIASVIFS
jgi:hypothetical protein